jgi:hypothetical protein
VSKQTAKEFVAKFPRASNCEPVSATFELSSGGEIKVYDDGNIYCPFKIEMHANNGCGDNDGWWIDIESLDELTTIMKGLRKVVKSREAE